MMMSDQASSASAMSLRRCCLTVLWRCRENELMALQTRTNHRILLLSSLVACRCALKIAVTSLMPSSNSSRCNIRRSFNSLPDTETEQMNIVRSCCVRHPAVFPLNYLVPYSIRIEYTASHCAWHCLQHSLHPAFISFDWINLGRTCLPSSHFYFFFVMCLIRCEPLRYSSTV